MPTKLRCFAAILLLAACGDALAGEDYVGEPIARLGGTITTSAGMVVPANVQLALVWHSAVPYTPPNSQVVVNPPVASRVDLDPRGALASFVLNVYEPPPLDAFVYPEHGDMPYAVGVLLAYQDTNGNGQLDCPLQGFGALGGRSRPEACPDKLVGAVLNSIVVFAPDAWPEEADAVFAHARHDSLGNAVSYDPGIRPHAGINFVHLSSVTDDHFSFTQCSCDEDQHPCGAPRQDPEGNPISADGWHCLYKGDPCSPLQAEPRASLTWPDNEVPELRIVHDVRDVLYESLMRSFEISGPHGDGTALREGSGN